jgi:hypothetical protein
MIVVHSLAGDLEPLAVSQRAIIKVILGKEVGVRLHLCITNLTRGVRTRIFRFEPSRVEVFEKSSSLFEPSFLLFTALFKSNFTKT